MPFQASGGWQCSFVATQLLTSLPVWSRYLLPFCVYHISLCLSLIRILVFAFRDHPDNPESSRHVKILNYICKDPLHKVTVTGSCFCDLLSLGSHHSAHYRQVKVGIPVTRPTGDWKEFISRRLRNGAVRRECFQSFFM